MFLFDLLCWTPTKTETRLINNGRAIQNKIWNLDRAVENAKNANVPANDRSQYVVLRKKLETAKYELNLFKIDNPGIFSFYLSGQNAYYAGNGEKLPHYSKRQIRESRVERINSSKPRISIGQKIIELAASAYQWLKKDIAGGVPLTLENIRSL